jgi:hypothetical protein
METATLDRPAAKERRTGSSKDKENVVQHQKTANKPWRLRALAAALASIAGLAGNASAFEIDTGNPDIETRWDNTFRYNVAVRAQGQDPAILPDPNLVDGDRNFSNGSLVANRLDILSEFDLVFQKYNVALQYTGYYGNYTTDQVTGVVTANGPNASLSDRGSVSLTLKATL